MAFGLDAFGDVDRSPHVAEIVARRIESRPTPGLHGPPLAIGSSDPNTSGEVIARLYCPKEVRQVGVAVVGMGWKSPIRVRHRCSCCSEVLAERLIHERENALGVGEPYHHRELVGDLADVVVASTNCLLGAPAGRLVGEDDRESAVLGQGRRRYVEPSTHHLGSLLELQCLASQPHSSVRLDPDPFESRYEFQRCPTDGVDQPGHRGEVCVDRIEPVVDRLSVVVIVDDDRACGEAEADRLDHRPQCLVRDGPRHRLVGAGTTLGNHGANVLRGAVPTTRRERPNAGPPPDPSSPVSGWSSIVGGKAERVWPGFSGEAVTPWNAAPTSPAPRSPAPRSLRHSLTPLPS